MPSELRVEKERVEATVTLSNGTSIRGYVFVSGFSATHSGPERIKDVLNAERGFFPFEVDGPSGAPTVLFNREHVVLLDLASDAELRQMPGYEHATRRTVSMLLSNGQRLSGLVRVVRPRGRDRLSDHAREGEQFWYLEGRNQTLIVNTHHVLEMTDSYA
jgi:sRNA-binding regulator protein Hfq